MVTRPATSPRDGEPSGGSVVVVGARLVVVVVGLAVVVVTWCGFVGRVELLVGPSVDTTGTAVLVASVAGGPAADAAQPASTVARPSPRRLPSALRARGARPEGRHLEKPC